MTRREKLSLVALVSAVVVAVALRFGVPWASRRIAIRSHYADFIVARNAAEAAMARPAPSDVSELFRLEKPRDALVELGYFEHRVVPLKSEYPPGAAAALHQDLVRQCDFDNGYFFITLWAAHRPAPAVEIWATHEQARVLEAVVHKHERKQAAEPQRAADAVSHGDGREGR